MKTEDKTPEEKKASELRELKLREIEKSFKTGFMKNWKVADKKK